jgi:exopolyphosphatase / guanosine-5'-triphosphate,3'-diphosphate pyrophosphatase
MDRSRRRKTGMNIASIDIGTNSVLLLVASLDSSGRMATIEYESRVPRLGRGVDAQRRLQSDSIARVIEVMLEYATMIRRHEVAAVVVGGTSAVRDAANTDDLARAIKTATGFELQVLSGSDEAIWTYRGAISGIDGFTSIAVIDIGGGSTEISVGTPSAITDHISLNVGSVRLTERFFKHDPPGPDEIARARSFIREHLHNAERFVHPDLRWIGVAGTATSIAALMQGKKEITIADLTNRLVRRIDVDRVFMKIVAMPARAIRSLSDVMEGRADVITAGTLILQEAMETFGCDRLTVSERGLRYGLVLREWERNKRIQHSDS